MNPTSASTPVTLTDGSIVIVSPLTSKDMMTIFNFVRQKELTRLLTSIPKDAPRDVQKMMIQTAYEQSNDFDISKNSLIWQDTEVMRQVFYMALRKETTGMNYDRIDKIMDVEADASLILAAINPEPKEEENVAENDVQKKSL